MIICAVWIIYLCHVYVWYVPRSHTWHIHDHIHHLCVPRIHCESTVIHVKKTHVVCFIALCWVLHRLEIHSRYPLERPTPTTYHDHIHYICVPRIYCESTVIDINETYVVSFIALYRVLYRLKIHSRPLTEEIRLKIFGSQDSQGFAASFCIDGDAVYSRETLFEILGTPEKTCWVCTGTPMKTCWKFWQSQLFSVRSPASVVLLQETYTYKVPRSHTLYMCATYLLWIYYDRHKRDLCRFFIPLYQVLYRLEIHGRYP